MTKDKGQRNLIIFGTNFERTPRKAAGVPPILPPIKSIQPSLYTFSHDLPANNGKTGTNNNTDKAA